MKRTLICTLAVLWVAGLAFADVSLVERKVLRQNLAAKGKPERSHQAATAPSFAAAPVGLQMLSDASGLVYFFNSDVSFSTTSSASGSASEATYNGPVAATTSGGGIVNTTLSDAFDGYNSLCISLSGAAGPCSVEDGQEEGEERPAGTAAVVKAEGDFVVYNDNGAAATDCGGRQVVFSPQTIGPFQVSRKVFVPAGDEFARWQNIITNTSGVPQTLSLVIAGNLGSDEETVIVSSADGDNIAETHDTWVTTFEQFNGDGTSPDPRLGHVLQGPGAPAPVSGISFSEGDDNPFWSYNLSLLPGETSIIMSFVTGQPSRAEANAKAEALSRLQPSAALQCMSEIEQRQIANFLVGEAVDITVPTVSEIGLMILGLSLLGAAMVILRRRPAA